MGPALKIVLIGPTGAGKSRLLWQLRGGEAAPAATPNSPTVGVEVHDWAGTSVWDVGGAPSWDGISTGYFLGADVIVGVAGADPPRLAEQVALARGVAPDAPLVLVARDGAGLAAELGAAALVEPDEAAGGALASAVASAVANAAALA